MLWLLEELGLPYEIKRYQRDAKTMLAPPELRAIHPLGKSPVITDGDKTIAETGAIVEYIIETYGEGRLVSAGGHAGAPALDLLAALRRGLGHGAAAAEAGVHRAAGRAPVLLKGLGQAASPRPRRAASSSRS